MHFPIENMCRACLTSGGALLSIFDVKLTSTVKIPDMLKAIASVQVSTNDGLPGKICLSCVCEINRAYLFKIKCENSDRTLRQYLNEQLIIKSNQLNQTTEEKIEDLFQQAQISLENCSNEINVENMSDKIILDTHLSAILEDQEDDMISELDSDQVEFVDQEESVNGNEQKDSCDNADTNRIYLRIHENVENCQEDQETHTVEILEKGITSNMKNREENINEDQCKNIDVQEEMPLIRLSCADCNVIFDDMEAFQRHSCIKEQETKQKKLKSKSSKKEPIICPHCPEEFVHQKNLNKHIKKHHEKKIIIQEMNEEIEDDINEESPNSEPLRFEMSAIDSQQNQQQIDTSFTCIDCGAGFAKERSLSFHVKLNKCTRQQFECVFCKKVFISKAKLIKHTEIHSIFQCSKCLKIFPNQDNLKAHVETDHSATYECPHCEKSFTMVSSLKDHIRIHSGEKPFLCSLCGRTFTQITNLKQHVMRHTQTKPYKCKQCDNSYVSKGELNSHMRIHTGDHPFICDTCGRGFTTSSSLVKHKRRHTGERPYKCEYCPMRFTVLGILKNHRRTHTGEKPFGCKFCDRSFAQKSDCVAHMRVHTGERPYVCNTCGNTFKQSGSLKSHMKSAHKTKSESQEILTILNESEEEEQSQLENIIEILKT